MEKYMEKYMKKGRNIRKNLIVNPKKCVQKSRLRSPGND